MRYRPLGPSGIEASVVALGAWAIGGWRWGGQDEAESIRAIHAALDAGINLIDTAPAYGFGRSETIVGRAIADRRDRVVLATKCGLVWDDARGTLFFVSDDHGMNEAGQYRIHKYLGPQSVRREVEASLARLGTDRIDLLQTHWQDPTTPIDETMAELLKLREEGLIRAIGACNASIEQMDAYRSAGPLASDQERYSMLDRQLDVEQLPYCREHGIATLAYSPLHHGLLTGKITAERTFGEGDLRQTGARFTPENLARTDELLGQVRPIAEAHQITLAQLAIAWTVAQPGLTHALVGARSAEQAGENAAAGDVELSADELTAIDGLLRGAAAMIA